MWAVAQRGAGIGTVQAKLPANERIYAIGDIHGRLDLFEQLVAAIAQDSAQRPPARVRLVLLGDIIDRGPDSAEIVARCRALAAASEDFIVLRGNHEQAMADALRGDAIAFEFWLRFGGDATLRSWGVPEETLAADDLADLLRAARQQVPAELLTWLGALPLSLKVGDYLFVHAGIRPGVGLWRQSREDILWIREEFLDSDADHACIVVHGHSISEDAPDVRHNRIGIDTGAYRTGRLTALGLEGTDRWTLVAEAEAERPLAELATLFPAADRTRGMEPAWSDRIS